MLMKEVEQNQVDTEKIQEEISSKLHIFKTDYL